MTNKVIRFHDPDWADAYADEAARLRKAFGASAQSLDHIGGTAVAGVFAKPIIDILVQVTALDDVDQRAEALEGLGYEVRGEYGIPGRRYFSKKVSTDNIQGYHVHVYEVGSHNARRHLAFRDFLLQHPEVAQQYSELKRSIADASGRLPEDYADRKSAFVQRVEQQALAHFEPAM